jgi:hypothetical protein
MNSPTYDYVPMAMPQGALVVAIPVLVVSIISLAASVMLFLMHFYHSERWSCTSSIIATFKHLTRVSILTRIIDVSLMAIAVSCSTSASICQQFWYITHWRHDRVSEYEQAKLGVDKPTLVLGPLTLGPSLVLFWIQVYFYNVLS